MAKKKVFLIGIDPKLIDPNLSTATGWDANRVRAAAQYANKRLVELGYELQSCLLDPRGTDESVVSDTLSREKFNCIMVGAGIRTLPQHTLLFEKIINTIPSECTIIFKNMFQYQSRRHRGSGPPLDVTNMAEL